MKESADVDNNNLKWLKDILYCDNNELIKKDIKLINNSHCLHVLAANYNWDNGFEIPKEIVNNNNCDFGTALMLFYDADGYRLLDTDIESSLFELVEWKDFISNLYNKILNNEFKNQNISYTPQISKVQRYKLKKKNPNIPDIILQKSPGFEAEVPKL